MSEPDVEQRLRLAVEALEWIAKEYGDMGAGMTAQAALDKIAAEEQKRLPLPLGHAFKDPGRSSDWCCHLLGYCGRPASEHE